MKKTKKGSSLIYVVVLISILIILGTASIALASSDYKMRINEGDKVSALYGAESGLNEAKIRLASLLDAALGAGRTQAKKGGSFEDGYKAYLLDNGGSSIINVIENVNEDSGCILTVENGDELKFDSDTDKMTVKVKSEFKNTDNVSKIVQADFVISVPQYSDVTFTDYGNDGTKMPWSQVITSGKNLIVRNSGSRETDIDGNIYIKNNVEIGEDAFGNGTNGALSISNGNLVCGGDINIKGASSENKLTMESGSDIYTGSISTDKGAGSCEINAYNSSVYSNNDLSVNADKSNIDIGSFYGINDKTGTKEDGYGESYGGEDQVLKKSSSIYVNSRDIGNGTSISITRNLVLMGTAYINTNPYYQTGESVAIKGNYAAYTEALKDSKNKLNADNIWFKYYNMMQLADSRRDNDSKLTYAEKSSYMRQYLEEYYNESISTGGDGKSPLIKYGDGISLPDRENIVTVAGVFAEKFGSDENKKPTDYFMESNYTVDSDFAKVKELQEQYSKSVNGIKTESINFDKTSEVSVDDIDRIISGLSGKYKNQVSIYLNGDSNVFDLKSWINEHDNGNGNNYGFVLTNGDVLIEDGTVFNGTIITSGNIICEGKSVIKYDSYLANAVGSELLKKGFISGSTSEEDSYENGIDTASLVEIDNWKLIK